MLNQSPLN